MTTTHHPDAGTDPRATATTDSTRTAGGASRVRPSSHPRRPRPCTRARCIALVVMLIVLAGPLLWQLSLSLTGPDDDIYRRPPQLIPSDPTLGNFADVIDRIPVLAFVANSFIVAAIVIGGNIVLATAEIGRAHV